MAEKRLCTSCNRSLANDTNSTIFKCPKCLKEEIRRCGECRKTSVKYKCRCGFEGP